MLDPCSIDIEVNVQFNKYSIQKSCEMSYGIFTYFHKISTFKNNICKNACILFSIKTLED